MVTRLIATLLTSIYALGCANNASQQSVQVTIAGEIFTLELSTDTPSRIHGMMERTSIPDHGGMLFVFTDAQQRSFWMANCFINIDLLFLDSRGTITATYAMRVEPPKLEEESQWSYEGRLKHYYSNGPARFAIELQEGEIQRLELYVNDRIPLDLANLRNLAR
jgi:uncharacterized membrane protein (UPF0127 family)